MLSDRLCECGCNEYTEIATRTDSRRQQRKGEAMRFIAGHTSNNGPARAGSNTGLATNGPGELDELKIRGLRSMSDADAARVLDERLRFLERQYKRNFVERGFILLEMEERELWKELVNPETGDTYTSFDRWVVTASPASRSDCFEAKRAVKELRDIPREQLLEIPRKNIDVLMQLSTGVRKDPDVITQAQTASKADFIGHIQEHHPDQHIEREAKQVTHPTVSQLEVIDLAREIAEWVYGSAGRESADEAISQYFLDGDCERGGYGEFSNRRAFETAKARGEIA